MTFKTILTNSSFNKRIFKNFLKCNKILKALTLFSKTLLLIKFHIWGRFHFNQKLNSRTFKSGLLINLIFRNNNISILTNNGLLNSISSNRTQICLSIPVYLVIKRNVKKITEPIIDVAKSQLPKASASSNPSNISSQSQASRSTQPPIQPQASNSSYSQSTPIKHIDQQEKKPSTPEVKELASIQNKTKNLHPSSEIQGFFPSLKTFFFGQEPTLTTSHDTSPPIPNSHEVVSHEPIQEIPPIIPQEEEIKPSYIPFSEKRFIAGTITDEHCPEDLGPEHKHFLVLENNTAFAYLTSSKGGQNDGQIHNTKLSNTKVDGSYIPKTTEKLSNSDDYGYKQKVITTIIIVDDYGFTTPSKIKGGQYVRSLETPIEFNQNQIIINQEATDFINEPSRVTKIEAIHKKTSLKTPERYQKENSEELEQENTTNPQKNEESDQI